MVDKIEIEVSFFEDGCSDSHRRTPSSIFED